MSLQFQNRHQGFALTTTLLLADAKNNWDRIEEALY